MRINKDGFCPFDKKKKTPEVDCIQFIDAEDPNDLMAKMFVYFKDSKTFSKYIKNGEVCIAFAPSEYLSEILSEVVKLRKELSFYRHLQQAA